MTKLLIVEDDLLLDEAYRRKFGDKFDIRVATDGETGMKMASSFSPDVIILDIYMAGRFNGLDVLKEIKKDVKTADIPIIVITNLPDSVERVMEMGAAKCFMKTDVDLNNIEDEIQTLIAKETK
ncbi:MAG: Response regulator receiver protein [uncultured bacterium]|uniref:Multi-sensor signal transduction histidine kinase n=1 Tax=Candidatus Collierbacteria bacterium GW2011_GWC2_44_18 TaxID=1618392 RepID=A0A0G1KL31_9BACT|nr:MAG: Response regulator receiver protein [uncultured bacterium]KKT30275.1 MAG: Multi-sensor signal transduction histidine kinase [Microgenomates group bacterium GW2011_GWC1_44_10]KKT48619.1 MAG: Multi-sensor signal transduction histidine kinase [Candidatus Collierbacteria bacterium GW2011_GWC2_44_18]